MATRDLRLPQRLYSIFGRLCFPTELPCPAYALLYCSLLHPVSASLHPPTKSISISTSWSWCTDLGFFFFEKCMLPPKYKVRHFFSHFELLPLLLRLAIIFTCGFSIFYSISRYYWENFPNSYPSPIVYPTRKFKSACIMSKMGEPLSIKDYSSIDPVFARTQALGTLQLRL